MILEIFLALLLGIVAGTFTGITPGIHINLIAAILVSFLLTYNIETIAPIVFIVSMSVTHTFIDFIPSIYLGAPDEDTALSTLPGHEFLMAGEGHKAAKLTIIGSVIATILLLVITPLSFFLIPKIYPLIEKMMAFLLIWISFILIYFEKNRKEILLIFFISGFLGIASLNLNLSQPLLPLLTGLFGTSTLIHSIKNKTKIPDQKIEKISLDKKDLIKPVLATALVSPLCSFFPGLGSSQAAVLGSKITGNLNREQFLILVGSINTLIISISFIALFLINKSRSGVANAISEITTITFQDLLTIIGVIIITSIVCIPLTVKISKVFAKNINKIDYGKISLAVLIFLIIITLVFTGFIGLIVLVTSTAIGLLCIELNVRKSFLMGCLLIPTILFYLPI